MTTYNIIVACCKNNGIGYKNTIPWFIKNDLRYFSKLTKGSDKNNAVIMGRKTWESLPKKFLPGRENFVLSRSLTNDSTPENITVYNDIEDLLSFIDERAFTEVWIIGGTAIYEQFYRYWNNLIHRIYITRVNKDYICDVYFPDISSDFQVISCETKEDIDLSDPENPESLQVEYQILERIKYKT